MILEITSVLKDLGIGLLHLIAGVFAIAVSLGLVLLIILIGVDTPMDDEREKKKKPFTRLPNGKVRTNKT